MNKCILLLLAVLLLSCAGTDNKRTTAVGDSPQEIRLLVRKIQLTKTIPDKTALIKTYLKSKKQNTIPMRTGENITFLYHGPAKHPVSIVGPFNNWKANADIMNRIRGTDFYHLTLRLPDPRRKGTPYLLCKNPLRYNDFFRDPLNKNIVNRPRAKASFLHPFDGKKGFIQIAHRFLRSGNNRVNARPITVYLPPSYFKSTKRYPVLYMQDGQNIWDRAGAPFGGWKVDTTADTMVAAGKIQEIIIVGIPHSGIYRRPEYYPEGKKFYDSAVKRVVAGWGEQFYKYITGKIKPLIDRTYRTLPDRKNTAVAGSSSGGVISWYLAWKHPETFSKAALLSPWFIRKYNTAGGKKRSLVYDLLRAPKKNVLFYIDTGDSGWKLDGVGPTQNMKRAMIRKGWRPGKDLFFILEPGAVHGEPAWRKRFPGLLKIFYGIK